MRGALEIERNYREAMTTNTEREFVAKGFSGWYRTHIRPFPDGLLASLTDVTEQKAAEEQASQLATEQSMLRRVAEAGVRGTEPGELFAMIARELGQLLGVRAASVGRDLGGTHTEVLGDWAADDDLKLALGIRGRTPPTSSAGRSRPAGRSAPRPPTPRSAGSLPPRAARRRSRFRCTPADGCGVGWSPPRWTRRPSPVMIARRQIELSELTGQAIGNIEAQEQLVRQATSDPLTGLVNHRAFHEGLREAVAGDQRAGAGLSLVLFDIDDFRVVDEMRGHRAGDHLLRAAAGALRESLHPGNLLARIGGDEFALVLHRVDATTAARMVERARGAGSRGTAGRRGDGS